MLKRKLLNKKVIIYIVIAFLTLLLAGKYKKVTEWLKDQWLELFYAAVMAVIAGVIIHYIYIKIAPKPKGLQPTMLKDPENSRTIPAKLILPNNTEIKITEDETIFGREDFVGAVSSKDSLYIGKKHFKIIKVDDRLYIEDLNTKNGTTLNGEEIKGLGRKELKGGDDILVAKTLLIKCIVETY